MMPKQFLVDDLGHQLSAVLVDLAEVRRRLLATQKAIESQRRMIEALRKRVDRQAAKLKARARTASSCGAQTERPTPTPAPCSRH